MTDKGWERIYQQEGDLGFRVLPKIRRIAGVFKTINFHKILDLGCGTGRHAIFLAQNGFYVQADDLSPTGIKIARKKAKSLNISNIRFKQHDMKAIPFSDSSFDAVICTWTIYHATQKEMMRIMAEIYRVLKPDGILVTDFLTTKDSTYGLGVEIEKDTFVGQKPGEEDVPHHYATRDEIRKLLNGFRESTILARAKSYIDESGHKFIRKYYDVEAVK
jgi:ubiquinone/menaquinone biosynthesis C-methylase UbiE